MAEPSPIDELTHDTERSLLSGILRNTAELDTVGAVVTGASFSDSTLGRVWDHLADLRAAGLALDDPSVLIGELKKSQLFAAMGGTSAIRELLRYSPRDGNVHYHAQEVARLHALRRLRSIADMIHVEAADAAADPHAITARVDAATVAAAPSNFDGLQTAQEMYIDAVAKMTAHAAGTKKHSVGTGLSKLDGFTGGMMPGELIILAARTSRGKTAFAVQVAFDAASIGRSTLLVSLEMSSYQLAQRFIAGDLEISINRQRDGTITKQDTDRISQAADEIADLPLMVYSARAATMAKIRGIARAHRARGGLDLLVIDYLQLIAPRDQRRPRYEQVTEISGAIKTLAMELDCPVMALAQLNRQSETADSPQLSHLRESGAIEQDADAVWFLHRAQDERETELIIKKHRQGKLQTFELLFDGERCRFDQA